MNQRKNLALEGLRGLACMNVVLGHFLFAFFPYLASPVRPYSDASATYTFEKVMRLPPFTFLYLADPAVSIFFVLSGYVLTRKFYTENRIESIQAAGVKRYIRLVLPVFGSVIFAWCLQSFGAYATQSSGDFLMAGWLQDIYARPINFFYAVMQGAFGAPLFGQISLNGPLWTLKIELVGSILLFLCYSLFGARSKTIMSLWFLYFSFIISPGTGAINYISILVGSFIHIIEPRLKARPWLAQSCLVLGLLGISVTHEFPFQFLDRVKLSNFTPYDHMLFWHTIGAILLVCGVIGSANASKILNHHVPVYLGRLSFSIYLLHFPLICSVSLRAAQFGKKAGLSYVTYAMFSLICLLLSLFILAEVFERLVDRPSIRLSERLARKTSADICADPLTARHQI